MLAPSGEKHAIMEGNLDNCQLEKLTQRIEAVAPQQCRASESIPREDPITGRIVTINPLRAARHFEVSREAPPKVTERENCLFCTGRTPSTLFYFDEEGKMVIEGEQKTIEVAAEYWKQPGKDHSKLTDHYGLVGTLGGITLPREWRARTFFNLTPMLGTNEPGNCYVTSVHPDYHYRDLPDMPTANLDAVLASWQLLEKLATAKGLVAVPFINGGRRPESGQSVSCFHSQTYVVNTPRLFDTIHDRRKERGCGVCEILNDGQYGIKRLGQNGNVWLGVHPAPARNYSLLVSVMNEDGTCPAKLSDLSDATRRTFAGALRLAIQVYRQMFGEIPAYNVAVRSGDSIGHLHAEIIPKTRTNVPAGFEDTTLEYALSELPERFAKMAREETSSDGWD